MSVLGGLRRQLARASSGPVRVLLDVRVLDERSGGIQQWVIGLANGLSRLSGPEEYLFLMREGRDGWLRPYLGGRCRAILDATPAAPAPSTIPPRATKPPAGTPVGRLRQFRRRLGATFPALRTMRRRLMRLRPGSWARKQRRSLSAFDRIAAGAGANVVHFPTQSASKTSVPSIFQPWDLQHVHLPEFFSDAQREGRERNYRLFCDQAALIVVATRWVQADVSAHFDIPRERIAVINPGPVTDVYEPPSPGDEAEVSARLGLPERYLFYPAQTWGHKNHERLFDALRLLLDRGIEVSLVCSGHRNERYPELVAYAAGLGLTGQVHFLGYLAPAEIQVLYRRATALVFPSLYEGWGLPILEAWAAGLPVACSNVTSLPELVGDAGLVFDPYDPVAIAAAVERLWTDVDLRTELAGRGRARVARFDWDRTARVMRAYYRRVAGRRLGGEDLALTTAEPLV